MKDARFEELLTFVISKTAKLSGYLSAAENGGGDPDVLLMLTRDANDAQSALVAYFEERVTTVMERLDVMRDRLENGMQENEDGTYTVIWTKRQLETAKKEAKRLYDKLFAEPDELPTVGAMGHGHD